MAKAAILPASETIDWKNPDYRALFDERSEKLERLRAHPEWVPDLRLHYRNNPADFINDWGVTFDPRNADIDRPSLIPFILTPRQREWIDWIIERWRSRTNGINEKSRDMGVTWLAVGLSCTLCLFRNGVVVGFGSRKAEYVDEAGTLKPILPKARMFMRHVPKEFRGDWTEWRDAPQMRINFPETGSLITGEGGDEIGRGDRTSIYFVDEAAHLPRPLLVDAALSQTTNCRIDMSSVNGMNNPFAQKRWGGKVPVFIFDWREDPRKDAEWYQEQVEKFDPVVVAQEIDRDYSASVQGIVIPGAWVRSAINAREKLGLPLSGLRGVSFDVADEGADKNAVCRSHGIEIVGSEEWSGKGSDIFATVQRVVNLCDEHGYRAFDYDADGIGADVRGDARVINDQRRAAGAHAIAAMGWRGSEAVVNPDGIVEGTRGREGDTGRTNKDFFMNRKAQGWWSLRRRFQRTYRWAVEGVACEPDEIVSISSKCPNYMKLIAELSQPTYQTNGVGKIVIDKKPNGMKSPNLADACMIRFAPKEAPPAEYTQELIQLIRQAGMRNRARRR